MNIREVQTTIVSIPVQHRIVSAVRDADREMHARLVAAGAAPFAEPRTIEMGGTRQKVFCCPDPDGFAVEFMEFLRAASGRA